MDLPIKFVIGLVLAVIVMALLGSMSINYVGSGEQTVMGWLP
jgi:hypothetical protein